jgi:hypothetical protein
MHIHSVDFRTNVDKTRILHKKYGASRRTASCMVCGRRHAKYVRMVVKKDDGTYRVVALGAGYGNYDVFKEMLFFSQRNFAKFRGRWKLIEKSDPEGSFKRWAEVCWWEAYGRDLNYMPLNAGKVTKRMADVCVRCKGTAVGGVWLSSLGGAGMQSAMDSKKMSRRMDGERKSVCWPCLQKCVKYSF